MAVEPVVGVARVWVRVVAAKVVTGSGVVVVNEIWVHVVDPVVHDGRGDILSGDSLGPGGSNVQV